MITPLDVEKKIKHKENLSIILGLIVVLLIFSYFIKLLFLCSLGVILCIFILSAVIESICSQKVKSLVLFLSYSSMCAYLFHRQLYGFTFKVSRLLFGDVYLWEIPIYISLLFLFSYIIQKIYDRCIFGYNI